MLFMTGHCEYSCPHGEAALAVPSTAKQWGGAGIIVKQDWDEESLCVESGPEIFSCG